MFTISITIIITTVPITSIIMNTVINSSMIIIIIIMSAECAGLAEGGGPNRQALARYNFTHRYSSNTKCSNRYIVNRMW